MNILITGGTGFIGSHLVQKLLFTEHNVIININKEFLPAFLNSKVTTINLSKISDKEAIKFLSKKKLDLIIHLATCFSKTKNIHESDAIIETNILFGVRLIRIGEQCGCKYFLNCRSYWEVNENISNIYLASKVSFYNICNSILETSKLKFIHIIIPDTYGPNDNRQKLIQNIISKIKTQSEMIFEFNGNNKIELCHIQDVVKYFINLLELIPNAESGTSHRLVCEKLKVKEIVKIIENYMNQTLVSTWGENPSPITNFNYRNTNILEIDKPIYLNQGLKSMT